MTTPTNWKQILSSLQAQAAVIEQQITAQGERVEALAKKVSSVTPNLFWNDADPEHCNYSIHELIEREWADGLMEIGDTMIVQRAIKMANVTVRVIADPEDPTGFNYEVLEDTQVPA